MWKLLGEKLSLFVSWPAFVSSLRNSPLTFSSKNADDTLPAGSLMEAFKNDCEGKTNVFFLSLHQAP